MGKKLKAVIAAVAALVTVGSLAACGSSSSSESDSGVKTVKIALETQDPPYSYADKDGKPAGFDLDVLKSLDEKLTDYKFEYELVDYQTALVGTKQGKYDAVVGAFFKTDARAKDYLLSKPYDYFFMNLIVPEGSKINKLEDLNGKTLDPIVPTDGRYVAIQDWLKRHPDVKIEVPTVTNQETFKDMFDAVHAGSYDAVYLSKAQYEGVADTLGYKMKVTDPVDAAGIRILYNKKQTDLQKAVDEQITAQIKDGSLAKLTQKHFGQDNFTEAKKLGVTIE
ncbi:transporter substrate-binding domain-containing protein [Bifidobacterium simiarum]|uniref:transporter substrate-binding domain-containing protein n=1 Tax=Bifidobacterium simiarum TaxID=2045441 RepID=UPI001BDC666A|nr:transporter substrate-binding domain-containing protein [Bifidobacterium simiarum]MBT1165374.1 transporter substrate-binding domain-containing protein [Bifidobacterium simiarum]